MFINNKNGRSGNDPNATDFFVDGSGSGNCFSGNSSSTVVTSPTASTESLYPDCPAPPPPASGTGGSAGDVTLQFGDLVDYVLSTPPENQQCSWTETPHPGFKDFEPSVVTPGPVCP
jgi:hypothetical protein